MKKIKHEIDQQTSPQPLEKLLIPMLKRMLPSLSPLFDTSDQTTAEDILKEFKGILPSLSEESRRKIYERAEEIAKEMNERSQKNSLIGTQPMPAPSGTIFAMRYCHESEGKDSEVQESDE